MTASTNMVLYTFSSFVESQKSKYFQVMGRTIRQSQRSTKSAYASRKRPRSNHTSVGPSTNKNSRRQSRQEVHRLRQDHVHDTLSNDGDNADQSINRIASTVAAQILPEVKGQAVTSIRTPSNDLPTSNGSGITFSNISSQTEIVPAQTFSINDSLGFDVSQQVKDTIFKGEYIELGILLDKSNSEVNKHLRWYLTLQVKFDLLV